MKAVEKYYNIHDVVTFKIVNNAGLLSRVLPFWDIELRDFESGANTEPDFTVFLGKFNPSVSDCLVMDDKFYIKKDYLYCSDSYKYAKWQLMISGFESGSTEVHISANPFAWMIIPDLIINPLIWFKLNEKGYAIVHGSGVVKNDRAYVFTGRGAAGKSTIALNLIKNRFKLLGDHFVVLGNDAVLSFLTPLHIADFNLLPIIRKRMKARHKIFFKLDRLSGRVTGMQVGTKISPGTMFPGLTGDKAKLHSVFLLLPREKFRAEKIDKDEFVSHIVSNQKLESLPFMKYMMEYSYLFPRSNMANHWTRYEQNLSRSLAGGEGLYRVEVPLKYDSETMESILQMVR